MNVSGWVTRYGPVDELIAAKDDTLALIAGSSRTLADAPREDSPSIPEDPGRIESVTVYRGQALVTRVIELPPSGGGGTVREVVVTDLPPAIRPG